MILTEFLLCTSSGPEPFKSSLPKSFHYFTLFLGPNTPVFPCFYSYCLQKTIGTNNFVFLALLVACSIFKSRDITLPTKVRLVKSMVFPVVMYGCESWTVKKAEHRRVDAFELWCWRRLLVVPWTARRSNQSILKEINPGCSLEGLMLKLKLQYFGTLATSWEELTHWKRP